MSNCPKCEMPDLIWTKTAKGKNWLKDQNGNWHTCQNVKPVEVSASSPMKPKNDNDWGDWDFSQNGRRGFYKCLKCPDGMGIFNRLDSDFQTYLKTHNSIIHPFGEDFSKLRITEVLDNY